MAANPSIDDVLLRRQVMLQRLTADEVKKFTPFLRRLDKVIREQLSGDNLTELNRKRLEQKLKAIDDLLDGVYATYSDSLVTDLQDIAEDEAAFSGKALAHGVEFETTLPSLVQIKTAILKNPLTMTTRGGGQMLESFIKDWTASERRGVIGAIRRGVFTGQTNAQIVQAIRGTKARNYEDGLLDVTRRNAATVVHTALQHVSSQAREATFAANADIVEKTQWLSTLDNKTCQQCRSLDGLIFDRGKGPRSPIHPYCRCTMLPYFIGKFAALNNLGSTRASVGAAGGQQVNAGFDYYAWLKTQPYSFQIAALGPVRAKLFRDGGLSAKRFAELQLDRNFQPLTLIEMKKLDPVAFEKAGV